MITIFDAYTLNVIDKFQLKNIKYHEPIAIRINTNGDLILFTEDIDSNQSISLPGSPYRLQLKP